MKKKNKDIHLKKESINFQQKAEEYLNNWKRVQADYLNLKRRIENEKKEIIVLANIDLVLQIIPVLDNFHRAFKHIPQEYKNSDWVVGIKHLEKQLEDVLNNEGFERIPTIGQEFNPQFHEALISESKKGVKNGTILEELEVGYKLKDKVIKAAKVKVAK